MSRELDARVAEKVMGLYPVRHCGKLYEFARKDPNAPLNIVRLSHYSTDIRAAFEVVEKLGEDGWIVTLHRDLKWFCDLVWFTADDTTWLPTTEADTLPEAICLAALKTVGEEAAE